jgi:quinohemoprotein ethanol dehydrogenase
VRQKRVWEVQLPVAWNPGTLTTAGELVFQGRADGHFAAYHAATGKELWRQPVGLGVSAPPITYRIDGRQYVALLVGWGAAFAAAGGEDAAALGWAYGRHMRRLVVYSLAGKADLPALPTPAPPEPLEASSFQVDAKRADAGADAYNQCIFCHGFDAISGGIAPDLRASSVVLSQDAFAEVVRAGAKRPRGMPSFGNLSDEQLLALRHYIREQAQLELKQD